MAWSFGLALLCLAAAALLPSWQSARLRAAQQRLEAANAQSLALQREAAASAPAPSPWWSRLPIQGARRDGRSTAEQLQADVMASATALSVQVLRVGLQPPSPARPDGPPFVATSVQVELRGSYADIKRWLAELLARRPGALAVKSIDMRRGADVAASSLEASVELRLFERTQ
jgi:type II secretory pathway pseudopilin PulG